jgi:hypothetical protein
MGRAIFVVHTGGWLFGRDVLIAPHAVSGVDDGNHRITLDLSREQVENAPPIDRARPVSRHYEIEYHRHYGWPPYWETSAFGVPTPPVVPPAAPMTKPPIEPPPEPADAPDNPHLRDSGEVMGYRLQARDSEIGHVHDLVLDDQDWRILELLHVGDVVAGLGTEHGIRGHRIAPLVNDARLGQVWASRSLAARPSG